MASICVGDDFYIFGGMGTSRSEFFNDLWRLRDGKWRLLDKGDGTAPSRRKYASFAYNGKSLFLFGGHSTKFYNDLWQYDIESGAWKLISRDGPSPRYTASLFYYDNALYLWGGCNIVNKKMRFFNDLWRFTTKWEEVTPPVSPSPRYGHCYRSHKGRLYVFGGYSGKDEKDFWALDIKKLKWKRLWQLWRRPSSRYCGLLESCGDDRLLLFGGKRWNSKTYYDTWIYDIGKNSWHEMRISNPLFHAKMGSGSTKDKVYLFGGQNKLNECLDDLWIFDVNKMEWELKKEVVDASSSKRKLEGVSGKIKL